MFRCVRGHGGWRARLVTVSSARWTSFSHRPMHVRPVWCWLACVRSVYGHVVSAVAVLLVCGRVSCLLVGSFGVGSLSLQRALAQSDLLRAGVLLVAVSVGASCVGPAWYVFTVRRLPTTGGKSNDKWSDRCKRKFPDSVTLSLPRSGSDACTTHHPVFRGVLYPSFQFPLCHSDVHPPASGKAPSVPLGVSLCSPWEPQGAIPARWSGASARVCLPVVRHIVPCFADHVGGVPVSRC